MTGQDLLTLRRGERVHLAEYPDSMWSRLNARLDAIAAEADEVSEPCS